MGRVFVDAESRAAEQRDELFEEFSAALPDPRDILEKDDRNRAVFVGLEREPDSAQGEPVERLVFVGRRMDRCEKTREALAGRRKKQHVGRLSPESQDRKSVVTGKSVSVRVDLGGRRIIKKKKKQNI